jgi:hypothetical protein
MHYSNICIDFIAINELDARGTGSYAALLNPAPHTSALDSALFRKMVPQA